MWIKWDKVGKVLSRTSGVESAVPNVNIRRGHCCGAWVSPLVLTECIPNARWDCSLPGPFHSVVFVVNDFEEEEEQSFLLVQRTGLLTACSKMWGSLSVPQLQGKPCMCSISLSPMYHHHGTWDQRGLSIHAESQALYCAFVSDPEVLWLLQYPWDSNRLIY